MYRYTTPTLFHAADPFLIWKMKKTDTPSLFLSFDDGPHPQITPWVLDLLKKYNAKATFFCVGENVRKYPDVFQRILDEGHAVGNHTHNHLNGWNTRNELWLQNVKQCAEVVDTKLFRPPYGRVSPGQTISLRKQGYRIVMWSILSRDFDQQLDQMESLNAMIQESQDGSIIVFHDSLKAQKNLEYLLPRYLAYFSTENFQFAPIVL